MGINARNIKLLAFAMGATFGGLSGGLFSAFQGFVSPESFTLLDSIMVLCMVVLGGMGNVGGVVLGAVLLTALPEALRYAGPLQQQWLGAVYVDPSDLRMLLFGLALVLMMLFRPAGLWPSTTRRRELAAEEIVVEEIPRAAD
jgi:branched-chain amino acid transport system permease protein